MNLNKIFETQKQLDAHITQKHPVQQGEDRISKKVLALLTELSECANEWRRFKFWSNDQEPRIEKKVMCHSCKGLGEHHLKDFNKVDQVNDDVETCLYCDGTGWQENINPLLEEYVDCLHFIVSIGIDLKVNSADIFLPTRTRDNAQDLFISLYPDVAYIDTGRKVAHYKYTFIRFLELGMQLGFTSPQIEDAYYAKNEINHMRQDNGY